MHELYPMSISQNDQFLMMLNSPVCTHCFEQVVEALSQ
jgi:hypothetical protein